MLFFTFIKGGGGTPLTGPPNLNGFSSIFRGGGKINIYKYLSAVTTAITALTGTATFLVLLRMETSKCETQEKESRLPKLRPPTPTVSSDTSYFV